MPNEHYDILPAYFALKYMFIPVNYDSTCNEIVTVNWLKYDR
jgi:hypothetical protein